ncbi:hypothetical protein Rhe02_91810 [Rhizocola hellebori]|uniref:FAS1 domain-containing protein n=1 Tax=Rhizocola hellebori TaxID=1392758 RepID=A0A8J3QHA5_9ACTN|nr:fasciclin domain-containing protein [Rhizocola hellebori]GIH11114.1 hypothetical protein Rhe02_91810 [Rhizocola hellebori]
MLSHKRLAVVVTSAFAALALSACTTLSASATTQPTPGPTQSGAADSEFGAGCAAVPTDPNDPASFEAMAKEPVVTALSANPMFSMFVAAVNKAGLAETLNNTGNITVFVPTNDAFAKVSAEDLNAVMADQTVLTQLLSYHVVPEALAPDKLAGTYQTQTGDNVTITGSGTEFKVNDTAKVVCGNVKTSNATVYAVDSILLPS